MRRWLVGLLFAVAVLMAGLRVPAREKPQEFGPPFQTVLEIETTARLLAILLDSGRAVINENQERFDDPDDRKKGLTPVVFEEQLVDMFRSRSGFDLRDLNASRLPQDAKKLLPVMVAASKHVVADFQSEINHRGLGFPGLIPAVFGSRVAGRFSDSTGVRLKQTSLTPRNPANSPDAFERSTLEAFADPSHPREQSISEVTVKGRALRLMYPLYTTRQCLVCHGGPKGEPDKTGYPREGLQLGQNAGAISVMIPLHK
ncbi:MAG: Tll0287-like domain-containing protein [Nitrospiraceae bacterium]